MKFTHGVEKEFKNNDMDDIPYFEESSDDDENENHLKFGKMPNTISEFDEIRQHIANLIFGQKPDTLLNKINNCLTNLDNLREALIANHFPHLIINLLYLPIFFIIMFFNCLREAIMWWIVAIIMILIFFALFGAFCALLYAGYRGYKIYTKRFDAKKEEKDDA